MGFEVTNALRQGDQAGIFDSVWKYETKLGGARLYFSLNRIAARECNRNVAKVKAFLDDQQF
jgi:hypothetical protein